MFAVQQDISQELKAKFEKLSFVLAKKMQQGLIVAFSGGVDSAFLLWTAETERKKSGGNLVALTTISPSFSENERNDAEKFASNLGVKHIWKKSLEFENPEYLKNDLNRCYHCKTELFRICREVKKEFDFSHIAYGFNASDRADFRPGHQAAKENEILSPLDEANLTKDEIRTLMRHFNLDLAEKPASPCLSSRLVTGVAVTPEKLQTIDRIENFLRLNGLKIFRVRVHENQTEKYLRIETSKSEMWKIIELHEDLVALGKEKGYQKVLLDLAGYKTGGANLPILQ